ncbi:uncharacterized protein LOC143147565 [Ptiloglossa arizonensis]|uniref:uncharacterized protein LOC143147565 n=1 Tax=Ptiloglossa arizonensis TaxID=3350558 RepID=UPI003F9F4056
MGGKILSAARLLFPPGGGRTDHRTRDYGRKNKRSSPNVVAASFRVDLRAARSKRETRGRDEGETREETANGTHEDRADRECRPDDDHERAPPTRSNHDAETPPRWFRVSRGSGHVGHVVADLADPTSPRDHPRPTISPPERAFPPGGGSVNRERVGAVPTKRGERDGSLEEHRPTRNSGTKEGKKRRRMHHGEKDVAPRRARSTWGFRAKRSAPESGNEYQKKGLRLRREPFFENEWRLRWTVGTVDAPCPRVETSHRGESWPCFSKRRDLDAKRRDFTGKIGPREWSAENENNVAAVADTEERSRGEEVRSGSLGERERKPRRKSPSSTE